MFKNIDSERVKKDLSRKQLSKMLGVSEPTLRSWINRDTELPASKVVEMTECFGCTADYLLTNYPDVGTA